MLKAAEKRPDMYEDIKKAWKWIEDADAVLIGASNGLSITEGLHLFVDNQAFEELFGDLKRKYGLSCILQGMGGRWPTEEEKWGFWSRLVHHYCGKYQETQVMSNLKTVIGNKDYFVVTSNPGAMTGFIPGESWRRKWRRQSRVEGFRPGWFPAVRPAAVPCRSTWNLKTLFRRQKARKGWRLF